MKHVFGFGSLVLMLSVFASANCSVAVADKGEKGTPEGTLEGKPSQPKYTFPKDPKTPVIVFNYRGGFTPPKISKEPTMSIYADGTVDMPKKFQNAKAYKGKLTPKELQELVHEILAVHQYGNYDQAKVTKKIAAEKARIQAAGGAIFRLADAPTVEIRVTANGKITESSYYPSGIDESVIEELQQRAAVQKRLSRLMSIIRIGGNQEAAKWLKRANAALLAQHPKVEPLTLDHFQSGGERNDGSVYVSFNRMEFDEDGKPIPNHLTAVSINQPAKGEPKINVTVRQGK